VYALVVARPNHPGLTPFLGDCDAIRSAREAAAKGTAPAAVESGPTGAAPCGLTSSTAIYSGGVTLATLAAQINRPAGRIVVDRTGLTGRYVFTLRFARSATNSDDPGAPPSIFTALQEQLGLRLDLARAPIPTLVIEHIDPPTED
jgi:uncharacterized protein (TIGR03435 family)